MYKCPQCDKTDQLDVSASTWVRLYQPTPDDFEGVDLQTTDESEDSSHDWNNSSYMICRHCGCEGTAAKFLVIPPNKLEQYQLDSLSNVHRFYADVSAAHITEQDGALLICEAATPTCLTAYKYDGGWWIMVQQEIKDLNDTVEELQRQGYSPDFIHLLRLVWKSHCMCIKLDESGEILKGFPQHPWSKAL